MKGFADDGAGIMKVERHEGRIVVDAAGLAPLLDLSPEEFQRQMREGRIATMSEDGEGEDEGRFRVTFRSEAWRLRLTCDRDGTVLSRVRTGLTPSASADGEDGAGGSTG
ncbi:DUF6522 family protein [Paracoccus sp. (in: a-proteobacteria)]|uniref:DUF6522 family protein n=1 Tax=Paracoccus sp. TaxID=267 RepID=UPI003A8C6047